MDPKQRLQLNFGGGFNTDRNYEPNNTRVFPTTPSTYPQPLYGNQGTASTPNPYAQQGPSPYAAAPAASAGGYFPPVGDNQRPLYQQQYQNQNYPSQQSNIPAPQPSYQQRQGPGGYNANNDPTSGLAHQFQNQNLGAPARQGSPFGRQPSPNARLYPNSQAPQSRSQQSHVSSQRMAQTPPATMLTPPTQDASGRAFNEDPPEKNPEQYSANVIKRAEGLSKFVESYFRENITRARERNQRATELQATLNDPTKSDAAKRAAIEDTRKGEIRYLRFLRTKEKPSNFHTVKIIGKGAFGEVKLVKRKTDGNIYALKSLVKTEMFKKDQLAHVRAERDILADSDNPWVVTLYTTFQDNTFLYMLMEFLPGGDLMTMLIKYEIFSIPITRFYMAEIVLAIEAVHQKGFIHRDIKPDNILLDDGGHVKLTDFGLSTGFFKEHDNSYYQELLKTSSDKNKKRENRQSVSLDQINLTISNRSQVNTWRKSRRVLAYSTVGTPDYIAPEIFGGQGYSYGCDWWSVGAIMFECLVGWPPFCAEDAHDTYRKIVNWKQHLYFPDDLTLPSDPSAAAAWPDAERCIRQLLCDVHDRLGTANGQYGAKEIKAHPFFRGVIWDKLREIRAPFKPDLKSNVDTTYFPIHEIDQNDHSAAHRAQVEGLGEENEAELSLPFVGYTFKRFDHFAGSK